MPVRTVEGIFRKLGYKDAIDFIAGYVYESVRRVEGKPVIIVVDFLERTWLKRGESTMADAAIEVFNEMEASGQI